MAPFYQRPENALKRAEELIAVGQNVAALQSLHEIVISKRSRSTPLVALEPIMLRFVELCVNLRKGKTAKEGLHQYKNISQNTSVTTIELVIKKFIELSEEKVTVAQAKADQITLDAIDDLEASETPESIMLSTVSGEQSKDRTDRAVVAPWLKFLWEAYRTVLDILRNNARLEILYQQTAHQAFLFCLKYTRKTEFRRLCDLLRNHLQNIAKYAHQPHSINLNEPESLQRHLDTRFNQLNAAVELELWQEAFRSVEDIHNLLSMSKRPAKPVMMANYYDKLTKIFLVSENYLFHAAAWNRYYTLVRAQNKALTDEENTRMASFVLLSALAIPVITSGSLVYIQSPTLVGNTIGNFGNISGGSFDLTKSGDDFQPAKKNKKSIGPSAETSLLKRQRSYLSDDDECSSSNSEIVPVLLINVFSDNKTTVSSTSTKEVEDKKPTTKKHQYITRDIASDALKAYQMCVLPVTYNHMDVLGYKQDEAEKSISIGAINFYNTDCTKLDIEAYCLQSNGFQLTISTSKYLFEDTIITMDLQDIEVPRTVKAFSKLIIAIKVILSWKARTRRNTDVFYEVLKEGYSHLKNEEQFIPKNFL